jgi:hypothetical protein
MPDTYNMKQAQANLTKLCRSGKRYVPFLIFKTAPKFNPKTEMEPRIRLFNAESQRWHG